MSTAARSFPGFPNAFAEDSWLIGGFVVSYLWDAVIRHVSHSQLSVCLWNFLLYKWRIPPQ